MNDQKHLCDVHLDDIAAYVDGELPSVGELELEAHFASCKSCAAELNVQKQLLHELEFNLKQNADIELPPDFAKVVVANAESTVAGLRRPRERFNALFISGGLGLFVLMSFGVSASTSLFFDKIAAVASFFGHFIYDVLLGVVVILRGVAVQARPEPVGAVLFATAFGISIFLLRKVAMRLLRP